MQRSRQTVGPAAMQWECNAVILCPAAGRGGGAAWNGSGQPEQMGSSWSYQEAIAIDGKFTRTAFATCWCVFWHKARKPLSFCFSILCQVCHNILHRLFISHLKKKIDARFRLLSKQRMWGPENLNCRMTAEERKDKHTEKAKQSRAFDGLT